MKKRPSILNVFKKFVAPQPITEIRAPIKLTNIDVYCCKAPTDNLNSGRGKKQKEYGGYITCAATCNLRCNTSEICNCPYIERKYPDHHLEIKQFLMEIRDFEKVTNIEKLSSEEIKIWLWLQKLKQKIKR
jgi:hypothetical protein